MKTRKLMALLLCTVFVLSLCGATAPAARSANPKVKIQSGPSLSIPRVYHTVTRLKNGKVLIVGGSTAPDVHVSSVEIFNPFGRKYIPAAPLHTARHGHSATLLRDGRVLVIGGYTLPQQWLGDAEIYNPSTDQWIQTQPLYSHGTAHTATLMKDGRVLVVGGCIGSGVCTERVEIFDPKTNTWTDAPPLQSDRGGHIAQLLHNGRVLVAGGSGSRGQVPADGDAVLYDPRTNNWIPAGPMVHSRTFAESVILPHGRVLIAGGHLLESPNMMISNSSEIYDPRTNTWTEVSSLSEARYGFVMTAFPNGQVLAIGGARDWDCCWTETSFVHEVESFDIRTNAWTVVADLPQPGAHLDGVLISNWQLWITGGQTQADHLDNTWFIFAKKYKR